MILASLAAAPATLPDSSRASGDEALRAGRLDDAARLYSQAIERSPADADLRVALGDVENALCAIDPAHVTRARDCWLNATAVKPDCRPALERLMHFWTEMANLSSADPDVYRKLRQASAQLLAVDPNNATAAMNICTSHIRPWLAGKPMDAEALRQAMSACDATVKAHPGEADLVLFVAQGKLKLADEAQQEHRDSESAALQAESQRIVDAGVRQNASAAMYFAAARIAQLRKALAGDANTAAEWKKKTFEYFERALDASEPSEANFVNISLAAAAAEDRREAALAILRKAYAHHPADAQVRLALAEKLGQAPADRAEAIAILQLPFSAAGLTGPKGLMAAELRIRTLAALANLQLDALAGAEPVERATLAEKIRSEIELIVLLEGESERARQLRKRLEPGQ